MEILTCFKAYDIRGQLGTELNDDIAYRIGRAYGELLHPKTMVVGGDVRATSESLKLALARGLQDAGSDVIDIGMVGTEEIYFATTYLEVDGGIEVTASHNPIDYNGMKLVREGSKPISGDTGLKDIQRLAEANDFAVVAQSEQEQSRSKENGAKGDGNKGNSTNRPTGKYRKESILDAYVQHLMGYVKPGNLKPLTLVVNAGNGAAGHVIVTTHSNYNTLTQPI